MEIISTIGKTIGGWISTDDSDVDAEFLGLVVLVAIGAIVAYKLASGR